VANPTAIHCIRRMRGETLGIFVETLMLPPVTFIDCYSVDPRTVPGHWQERHGRSVQSEAATLHKAATPAHHNSGGRGIPSEAPLLNSPYFTCASCPRTAPLGKFLLWTLT
jgi:hypothetical protein